MQTQAATSSKGQLMAGIQGYQRPAAGIAPQGVIRGHLREQLRPASWCTSLPMWSENTGQHGNCQQFAHGARTRVTGARASNLEAS